MFPILWETCTDTLKVTKPKKSNNIFEMGIELLIVSVMKTKSKRNITNVTHSPCVKYILIMEFIKVIFLC